MVRMVMMLRIWVGVVDDARGGNEEGVKVLYEDCDDEYGDVEDSEDVG